MRYRTHIWPLLVLGAVTLFACSSNRMSTRTASQRLKPAAPLPLREQMQLPVNLSIEVRNVADTGPSFKNYFVLFINGKEIAPERPENNFKSTYRYQLRLQPGVYDVEGEYHVVGFWKERVYKITTDEMVKVLPGKRTELSITLKKDSRGMPEQKQNLFDIAYKRISDGIHVAAEAEEAGPLPRAAADENAPEPEPELMARKEPLRETPPAHPRRLQPPVPGGVQLQINTLPLGADVYVDDRYIGQSPARAVVSAAERHVIQIVKEGYAEYLKVLDAAALQQQDELQLVLRLQKLE